MEDLLIKKCVPCEGGMSGLTESEITKMLKQLHTGWGLEGKKIKRTFRFVNFRHTMEFVVRVAEVAEQEGHHPVMHVEYGLCRIDIWTHAINDLSENDFILAAKIDRVF